MLKKFVSLLLVLLFAMSAMVLASCDNEGEKDKSGASTSDVSGFQNPAKVWDEEVNILTFKHESYAFSYCQVDTEELNDEPVNDAFYERNALIKEQYGIDINAIFPKAEEDYIQMLKDDMLSGSGEFDCIIGQFTYTAPLVMEGLFYDLNDVGNDYLHLDMEWWDQALIKQTSINNNVYFVSGDALVEDDEATWAIYFNKDLVESYGIESPYDIVRDNRWTFDTMHELIQQVSLTHGGQKSFDPSVGDVWGMVAQSYDFLLFMQGAGQTLVDNSGDEPVLRIDDERNIQVFMEFTNMMYDEENVGIADRHGYWEDMYANEGKIFENGNALFMPYSISLVSEPGMREAEIRYGLLPMPKADELQEAYTTGVNVYHYPIIAIPTSNVDKLDVTCYALEAMAFYGRQLVTEEYYVRTLTYKRFHDDESRDMLDLIFRNRTYDMGTIFNFHGGDNDGCLYFYTHLIGDLKTDIVSLYETKKNSYQSGLDSLIEQCYTE